MSSSFDKPLADEVDLAGNRFKVYEDQAGHLTVSYSATPGMWTGLTIPVEAADLLLETVAAAIATRESIGVVRILVALNAYGFKICEEVDGQLTVSFSKSPGMWAGFTIPVEATDLLLETVAAAVAIRAGEVAE